MTELDLTGGLQDVVDRHNYYRRKHGAPYLVWNQKLANAAEKCVNHQNRRRRRRPIQHCPTRYRGRGTGQNIAAGKKLLDHFYRGVDWWYKEIKYTPDKKGKVPNSGNSKAYHYTQVVSKRSNQIGCAANNFYLVCNYFPHGNMMGKFEEYVQPLGK